MVSPGVRAQNSEGLAQLWFRRYHIRDAEGGAVVVVDFDPPARVRFRQGDLPQGPHGPGPGAAAAVKAIKDRGLKGELRANDDDTLSLWVAEA